LRSQFVCPPPPASPAAPPNTKNHGGLPLAPPPIIPPRCENSGEASGKKTQIRCNQRSASFVPNCVSVILEARQAGESAPANQKMIKKRTFLIAVTSVLTAFSGNHAQAQVYTPPTTGVPQINTKPTPSAEPGLDKTGWSFKSILWNGENPRVTFADATLDLKGTSPYEEKLTTDLFQILNYGGFLNTTQDARLGAGMGLGKSPWVDSFTYLYRNAQTITDRVNFTARLRAGYGEESKDIVVDGNNAVQSVVVKGKVGLMLRSTLACDSPYVMMAVTNEQGPQFSWRSKKGEPAQAAVVSKSNSDLTKSPDKYRVFRVRLVRTGTTVTGHVGVEKTDGTLDWRLFGAAFFPEGNCYVGFAAAANTAADSQVTGRKQYQVGEFDEFFGFLGR
jgi:hypothetical protein